MATENEYSLDLERSSSQYASIADGSQTGLDLSNTFAIEAWVKLESLPGAGNNYMIVSKSDTNSQRSYALYIAGTGSSGNNKLRIFWSYNGTSSDWIEASNEFVAGDLGKWIHIAGYATPSAGTGGFYRNGVSWASTAYTGSDTSIYNGTAPFAIGCSFATGSASGFFDGMIDEVAIYADIRTQAEIVKYMFQQKDTGDANLKGYWKLENNYLDETSNNNDLTASGSPVFASGADDVPFTYYLESGDNLASMYFTTDDAISITNHADLRPTGNWTVGAWVKTTTSAYCTVLQSWSANTNIAGIMLQIRDNGTISMYSGKNTGTTSDVDYARPVSTGVVNDGNWHFIVGIWDGSYIKQYIDGVEDGTVAWANAAAYAGTNYVRIGCRNNAGTNLEFFPGNLDGVFLVNGSAWSATTIRSYLYKKIPSDTTNLKALWDFEGDILDSTANNHDGALISVPYYKPDPAFDNDADRHSIDIELSSSQYAYITDANQTGLDLGATLTIEAWVKFESLPGTSERRAIVSKYLAAGDQRSYYFNFLKDSGDATHLEYVTSALGDTTVVTLRSSWSPSTGIWYHVAVSVNATANETKFYVNGSQLGATITTSVSAPYNGTAPFEVGALSGANFMDGLIDDLRIFNDIRTLTEIDDNKDVLIDPTTANLVGYWRLDNNYLDLTSNGNHLTPSGSPVFSRIVPFDGAVGFYSKNLTETITITDSLAKLTSRSLPETIIITDAIDTLKLSIKNFTETITITDVFSRVITYVRGLTETITITDAIAKIRTGVRTFTETITITDIFAKIRTQFRTFAETITITDRIRKYLNGFLISIWSKIEKTAVVFSKVAKPTTTFTKVAKSIADIWTKSEKPEA